ncbi:hypothetical protein NSS78_16400 [Bacillus sp. FSL W8-0920]|uniref:hypothetical protein n=1 Tax=Bacillus sp. FSL W8-0920 TaxID=2954636 RepID=UPI003158599E
MKIGHLTFGTPEYVRVTKMAERDAKESDAIQAWDEWFYGLGDRLTTAERSILGTIHEEIESKLY